MKRTPSSGITLIELLIAVSLASFVLIGVAGVAAQMARNQVEGIRSGTVTGWSVVSYSAMAKEIEDANVLAYPPNNGDVADAIIICKNWSRATAARLDTTNPVAVVQYCVDPTAPIAPETGFTLRRYANVGAGVSCPNPGVLVPCNTMTPAGTWTQVSVVGYRLEKLPGFANVFTRDDSIGGIRMRYAMGSQTGTTQKPVARFTPFYLTVAMDKAYNTTGTND